MRLVNDTDREYWEIDYRRYGKVEQEDLVYTTTACQGGKAKGQRERYERFWINGEGVDDL